MNERRLQRPRMKTPNKSKSVARGSLRGLVSQPRRIQLSRKRGWRKPANTVVVARPSKWGNPFHVSTACTAAGAVKLFEARSTCLPARVKAIRKELRGKNLACWCPVLKCDTCGSITGGQKVPIEGTSCMESNRSGTRWCCGVLRKVPCHADVLLRLANQPTLR